MRRRSRVAVTVLAATLALVAASPAAGGGWAAVELSSTPDGLRAGEEWVVDLTVLQHGQTPLAGVTPAVTVRSPGGEASEGFVARPTEQTGVYRARVTFPSAGEWKYVVDDGFGQEHTYPAVTIGEAAPVAVDRDAAPATADAGGIAGAVIAVVLLFGLAAAGLTVILRRRRPGRGLEGTPTAM